MRSLTIPLLALVLALASLLPAGSASAQETPPTAAPAIPPIVWRLTSFPGVTAPIEPGRYTVQFLPDGTVNIRADCNWVLGVWNGGDGLLDITAMQTTVAACPEDSLEQPYVQGLDEATGYTIDASMTLIIIGPIGEMRFSPVLPAMAQSLTPPPAAA
jgi:heat shock protein HslJ